MVPFQDCLSLEPAIIIATLRCLFLLFWFKFSSCKTFQLYFLKADLLYNPNAKIKHNKLTAHGNKLNQNGETKILLEHSSSFMLYRMFYYELPVLYFNQNFIFTSIITHRNKCNSNFLFPENTEKANRLEELWL